MQRNALHCDAILLCNVVKGREHIRACLHGLHTCVYVHGVRAPSFLHARLPPVHAALFAAVHDLTRFLLATARGNTAE